jgi:hypothetical protein
MMAIGSTAASAAMSFSSFKSVLTSIATEGSKLAGKAGWIAAAITLVLTALPTITQWVDNLI